MTGTMKAVVWDGGDLPQSLSYRDFKMPEPPLGWVLIHIRAAGICGSDLHYLQGYARDQIPAGNLPAVLGHENAGVVVQIGDAVTQFQPGDRVAIEPLHACTLFGDTCPMCAVGKYHLCMNGVTHVGLPFVRMLPGGFGEYSIAHHTRLYPLPDSISFEEASLLDNLAVAVHAVNMGQASINNIVVVVGCGTIGLDLIQCLLLRGTTIIAIAKYDFQAELANQLGAKYVFVLDAKLDPIKEILVITGGIGADQVYECVGGQGDALNQAIAMCRMGGSVVMVGEYYGLNPINLFGMMMKEVSILSSNGYSTHQCEREFQVALNLLQERKVDHHRLITSRFIPEQYQEAIETSLNKKSNHAVKTIFVREN